MIFGLGFNVVNIDNKIQISISEDTEVGQRIKREGEAEYKRCYWYTNDCTTP